MKDDITTIAVAIFASTGFWSIIQRWIDRKSAKTQLLLGLAQACLKEMCMEVLNHEYITHDELESIQHLYDPYKACGGNGVGEKFYRDVTMLPVLRTSQKKEEIFDDE